MSSSLSGGTNVLNFNVVKKTSSSTITSLSSTLTITEASNISQSSIRTKRPRTNRNRPNQKYNEAADLLSKSYPNLFRNIKKLPTPCKFTKPITTEYNNNSNDFFEPLLLPFNFRACDYNNGSKKLNCKSASQTEFFAVEEVSLTSEVLNSDEVLEFDFGEEFDCKSILEEEIDEGIDSIMGSRVEDDGNNGGDGGGDRGGRGELCYGDGERVDSWFGEFGRKFGMARALRRVDGVNLLNFAMVDVLEISPGMKKTPATVTEKKKQRKKESVERENLSLDLPLRLKLNYEDVRSLWSERGLPFRR